MFKNFLKHYYKQIICSFVSFLLLLISDCVIGIFNNYGNVNAAEYISENMKKCKKNPENNRVEFEMITKNGKSSWFPSNYMAVAALFNSGRNNSMYFSYEENSDENWLINNTNYVNKAETYGLGFGTVTYMPLGIKILAGKIDYSDFDVTLKQYGSDNGGWCIISKTYAQGLQNELSLESYKDLIGFELSIPNIRDGSLTIKAICDDANLISNNKKGKSFVISNYFAFSNYLENERLVFKASSDKNGMNFTIFRQLLYSSAWQTPFDSNDNHFSILTSPSNEWIVAEAEIIYLQNTPKLSFISTITLFSFVAIGFYISRQKPFFKNGKLIPYLIVLTIFFLSFSLSFMFVGVLKIGGYHLIGRSLISTINEVIGCIVLMCTIAIASSINKYNYEKDVLEKNSDYYEIKI